MGAWGVRLNQNDFAEDIRTKYKEKLASGISNEEAEQQMINEYEGILDDFDDGPNFWFVLADQQWRLGRLSDNVKNHALALIESGADLAVWYEESQKLGDARKKVLDELKERLKSPQPPEKRVYKKRQYICPWNVGDAFALPLQSELAIESGLEGKYIIFQVGEMCRYGKKNEELYPVVRCWISDHAEFSADLSKRSRCVTAFGGPRIDGNYNYGYMIFTTSARGIPKSLIYLGNFDVYRPDDDGADFAEASFHVVWKFFEKQIISDYNFQHIRKIQRLLDTK